MDERKTMNSLSRYERQMILPQMGIRGQKKLLSSKVLVIGAGGLGCPTLIYLAGAGIGTIGIADADCVSESNLHRQILHPVKNVGKNKAKSAAEALTALNPDIKINIYPEYITSDNISQIIADYDFIIDAVDNFETKFLINDACVQAKKPFCHAGVIQYHGQIMTYVPQKGPCYRCIFQEIPENGSIPNCAQVGVMGAVCGILGSMQAMEAIKYLSGSGELLTGKMLIYDAFTLKCRSVTFPNSSPTCRVCGKNADLKDVRENRREYLRDV